MCEIESVPCPDRPCEHGICFSDQEGRHSCKCDHRFEGQYCELDKDECALKVCPADATCVNLTPQHNDDKGYSCICPEGYTGEFCELEVDLCELHIKQGGNYCYNGGVCEARYVCMCQDGFGGPRCAHRVPRLEEYEEFGCPERAEVCAKLFDDGKCDEICNRESCLFDGFDCNKREGAVCRHPSECAYKYGDGRCDEECAGLECGYDGGDCEGKNATSYSSDANMIGVAVGVPPDIAVKNLRQLQAELAQRLYTHVSLAEDRDGIMVFEWATDSGQGNRITVVDEQVVASEVDTNVNGTMVFFDVDTSACRIRRRKGYAQPRCFTDLRAAATYLTLELARSGPLGGETLPIRDISWKKRQVSTLPFI
ncbi:EGF-like domain protein, partial [Cooperia oncophora]